MSSPPLCLEGCARGWGGETLLGQHSTTSLRSPGMPDLFDPIRVGGWELANRLVMAPLTRNRATDGMVPGELAVRYYAQRASAGLIVTEGTQPSAVGQGYLNTPGIHSAEQVVGWRRVADAVHERGGR